MGLIKHFIIFFSSEVIGSALKSRTGDINAPLSCRLTGARCQQALTRALLSSTPIHLAYKTLNCFGSLFQSSTTLRLNGLSRFRRGIRTCIGVGSFLNAQQVNHIGNGRGIYLIQNLVTDRICREAASGSLSRVHNISYL